MLKLEHIYKSFNIGTPDEVVLFNDFNLSVDKGEFVSVVGSNGCGKTTMLNIICGSTAIEGGRVLIAGEDMTKKKDFMRYKNIGRVYQNPAMGSCADMTVTENMSIADNKGRAWGLQRGTDKKRVSYYKELVAALGQNLENRMDVKVGSLSGGQRQSLALLMATMTPIDFLILDEHTAALDPRAAETVMELTDKVIKEKNLTALMVTHNLRYAVEYGSRLLMMDAGECILDIKGKEKEDANVDTLLNKFYSISVEKGNGI